MMRETPIIMSGDHPKLILDGLKTMTRRVIKLKDYSEEIWDKCVPHSTEQSIFKSVRTGQKVPYLKVPYDPIVDNAGCRIFCPYGQVGDGLWVRETWATERRLDNLTIQELGHASEMPLFYKADDSHSLLEMGTWRPSIYMPRWASRILLEITEVRVERLQEIAESDTEKEGILRPTISMGTNRQAFANLWDSLNAKRSYGWETNPWVWVIGFKMVDR